MQKTLRRLFAWVVLLGCGVGGILAGIVAGQSDTLNRFVVYAPEPGPMANWAFFFVSLGVGVCVYLIRGVDGGGWHLNASSVSTVLVAAVFLLFFGTRALFVIAILGPVSYAITLLLRKSGGDT